MEEKKNNTPREELKDEAPDKVSGGGNNGGKRPFPEKDTPSPIKRRLCY